MLLFFGCYYYIYHSVWVYGFSWFHNSLNLTWLEMTPIIIIWSYPQQSVILTQIISVHLSLLCWILNYYMDTTTSFLSSDPIFKTLIWQASAGRLHLHTDMIKWNLICIVHTFTDGKLQTIKEWILIFIAIVI